MGRGHGETINLYHDWWIPNNTKHLSHFIPIDHRSSFCQKNSSLVYQTLDGLSWNIPKLLDIFPESIILRNLAIQLPVSLSLDLLVWPYTSSNHYSTKSGTDRSTTKNVIRRHLLVLLLFCTQRSKCVEYNLEVRPTIAYQSFHLELCKVNPCSKK